MTLLESGDNAYLIQEAQPNAAENRIMKYVGVARKRRRGIVQVGFKPTRQMEAISRNTYDYIFQGSLRISERNFLWSMLPPEKSLAILTAWAKISMRTAINWNSSMIAKAERT